MENEDKQTFSIWMTATRPDFASLDADKRTQVCIVGAGIAGLTTAYLLAREGTSVVVLDDGPIASGMTQRTTAHLSNALDDRYTKIERLHGQKGARLSAESHTAAIDLIEKISADEKIDCDFQRLDGYLFTAPDETAGVLEDELEAAHRAGLDQVALIQRAPLGFDTGPCLRFPRQAQFHPLKYLSGVAQAIDRMGGRICTGTHVARIHSGQSPKVETNNGFAVAADSIVVATNTPINNLLTIHLKQAPYTTYAIAARIPTGSVPAALYWDTADPYHYIRMQPGSAGYDHLIVGGEDHKTGQTKDQEQRHGRLERWARERFPMMEKVDFRWSGMVMEPDDKIAFIGRNPGSRDNIFIATGDSGMGITHGTLAGVLIRDLILGRDNPWKDLYDPARVTLKALASYIKENVNVGLKAAMGYLGAGDVPTVEDIQPGEGAVIRRGIKKIAVYRDEQGGLHERSALCRHLECIVSWNNLEKTWDCPCHGSRFDRFGAVINGPARKGLKPRHPADDA